MTLEKYYDLVFKLKDLGYEEERWHVEFRTTCESAADFFCEATWVICNSGMKEQIARKIFRNIINAIGEEKPISSVFGHKGKVAAIEHVWKNQETLFKQYHKEKDKIAFLKSIPFVGDITKYHLARNLGMDVVKPDRHLVRIAEEYNTTPHELCDKLAKESGDRIGTVDVVLWRAANLKLI